MEGTSMSDSNQSDGADEAVTVTDMTGEAMPIRWEDRSAMSKVATAIQVNTRGIRWLKSFVERKFVSHEKAMGDVIEGHVDSFVHNALGEADLSSHLDMDALISDVIDNIDMDSMVEGAMDDLTSTVEDLSCSVDELGNSMDSLTDEMGTKVEDAIEEMDVESMVEGAVGELTCTVEDLSSSVDEMVSAMGTLVDDMDLKISEAAKRAAMEASSDSDAACAILAESVSKIEEMISELYAGSF
jgi:uncharacterized protein YoxC